MHLTTLGALRRLTTITTQNLTVTGTLTTSSSVTATGKITLNTATPAATLLIGTGTTSARYAMGTTANQQVVGLFAESTATTGDSRVINSRLYFTGAGGSGEVIRAMGVVNGVTAATGGTVNGAHLTLSVTGAAGAVSGAGNALRATLALGAATVSGGTLAVIQADSDLDATATIPATASYIRFTNSNTGKVPILMNLDGVDTSTLYIAAGTSSGSAGKSDGCAAQKVVQIRVNGAACYIPVFTQNT